MQKKSEIEQKREQRILLNHAIKLGISVAELIDINNQKSINYTNKLAKEKEAEQRILNATFEEFKNYFYFVLNKICIENKSTFDQTANDVLYTELLKYFYTGDFDSALLDKNRHLYIFGVYGCGKSVFIKSIISTLKYFRKYNFAYFQIPTLVQNYIENLQNGVKLNPFSQLHNCTADFIFLDEIGDKCEKLKVYGQDIEDIRNFIIKKNDIWLRNKTQKLILTSNLFPDERYFFTKIENDTRPTLKNFYDGKIHNKMGEMCNLVRFPNISYRELNKKELLF